VLFEQMFSVYPKNCTKPINTGKIQSYETDC
jgi:hypothetical protein